MASGQGDEASLDAIYAGSELLLFHVHDIILNIDPDVSLEFREIINVHDFNCD